MKMIIAIVEDQFTEATSSSLVKADFRITRLASTGGFFREGATTLMIGVENNQLETALEIIRGQIPFSDNPKKIHATIYVLNIKDFQRV
ncbi:MAG: cyclic-di-AMP receptor [Anaerolineales bacterium]|jgi:uncharacterized protein YaaQ